MKALRFLIIAVLPLAFSTVFAQGDAEVGRQKAHMCMFCHGGKDFGGFFLQLQLAGRNADKLATKTDEYRSGNIINPMMNMWVMGLSDQDVLDISAYYESLEKPAVWVEGIRGDDDES